MINYYKKNNSSGEISGTTRYIYYTKSGEERICSFIFTAEYCKETKNNLCRYKYISPESKENILVLNNEELSNFLHYINAFNKEEQEWSENKFNDIFNKYLYLVEDIKACPFCGSEALLNSYTDDNNKTEYIVTCSKCSCDMEYSHTKKDAIDLWNNHN